MSDNTPLTSDALAQAVAAIRERVEVAPVVTYQQTATLSIFRDHDNSLAELDAFGNVTVWDNDVVFSDAACSLFASAKSDIRLLLQALAAAEARAGRYQAERDAALTIATNMSFVANVGVVLPRDLRELKAAIAHADANVQPGTNAPLADDDGNGGVT